MQTENVQDASSWWSGNTFDKPQPLTPDTKDKQELTTDPPEGDVVNTSLTQDKEEEKKEPEIVLEALPEEVSNVFGKILENEDYGLGYYEGAKIETEADVIDFIDINVNARLEREMEGLEAKWLATKSPVFQEIAQMAQAVGNDHTKFYQFLETQRSIDDYNILDPKNTSHAELIVENYLQTIRKEPQQVIDLEIKDLKERGKLEEKAEGYKPVLVKTLEEQKTKMKQDEEQRTTQFIQTVQNHQKEIGGFVMNKDVAGMKVTNDDRDIIYNNLSFDPELGGFPIHKKIDDLMGGKNWDLLAKVSLMIEKEERFEQLYGTRVKNEVATGLRNIVFNTKKSTVEGGEAKTKPAVVSKKEEKQQETKAFSPWG